MTVRERWGAEAVGWLWAAVAVTMAAALLLAWLLYRQSQADPVPWTKPAQVDGDLVRVTYVGSACRDDVRVDVEEGRRQVTVTVRERAADGSCPAVGVPYEVEVRLGRPLGDRVLVDGACQLEDFVDDAECLQPETVG